MESLVYTDAEELLGGPAGALTLRDTSLTGLETGRKAYKSRGGKETPAGHRVDGLGGVWSKSCAGEDGAG